MDEQDEDKEEVKERKGERRGWEKMQEKEERGIKPEHEHDGTSYHLQLGADGSHEAHLKLGCLQVKGLLSLRMAAWVSLDLTLKATRSHGENA